MRRSPADGRIRPRPRLDSLGRPMPVHELASVDGAIAPTAETSIPLKDDGLYRGDGVFEVIRLYGGRPFALVEHLDRLERSAAAIDAARPARRARARDRGAARGSTARPTRSCG